MFTITPWLLNVNREQLHFLRCILTTYILLNFLISSSVANNSVCVRTVEYCLESVEKYICTLKPKPRNKTVNAVYFYLSAEIFESVTQSLFVYD